MSVLETGPGKPWKTACRCGATLCFSDYDIKTGQPMDGSDFWCSSDDPGLHDHGVVVHGAPESQEPSGLTPTRIPERPREKPYMPPSCPVCGAPLVASHCPRCGKELKRRGVQWTSGFFGSPLIPGPFWQLAASHSVSGSGITSVEFGNVYLESNDWISVIVGLRSDSATPSVPLSIVWQSSPPQALETGAVNAIHSTSFMRLRQRYDSNSGTAQTASIFINTNGAVKPQSLVAVALVKRGGNSALGTDVHSANDQAASTDPQWIPGALGGPPGNQDITLAVLRSDDGAQGSWIADFLELHTISAPSPALQLSVSRRQANFGASETVGKTGTSSASWCGHPGDVGDA